MVTLVGTTEAQLDPCVVYIGLLINGKTPSSIALKKRLCGKCGRYVNGVRIGQISGQRARKLIGSKSDGN